MQDCDYFSTDLILIHLLLLFSCYATTDSLWLHKLQQNRLPCPLPSPRVCSNSCPLSWWCHPTISSSIAPFSSCPQTSPASRSFSMSWLLPSGAKVLELQHQHQPFQWIFRVDFQQDWLRLSPYCWRTLKSLLLHHSSKLCAPTLTYTHGYWKNHSFD